MYYILNINFCSCQIPFYSLSLKTQKLLFLLIMNSMRKCSLSLMGAIVVSHDLFAKHYGLIKIYLNSQYENHFLSLRYYVICNEFHRREWLMIFDCWI
ncbi:uncharacterized protein V1477_013802, partial [Vespula maculifrons]